MSRRIPLRRARLRRHRRRDPLSIGDTFRLSAAGTAGLRSNLVANYVGQGWRALMGLLIYPSLHQVPWSGGLRPHRNPCHPAGVAVAARRGHEAGFEPELARFTGGAHSVRWICDLLRSVEVLVMAIAAAAALAIWAASRWLASEWVAPQDLPRDTVARAFALMGLVAALRFIESVYTSVLVGLQRQVTENVLSMFWRRCERWVRFASWLG